ncbi:MAG: GNAT family N-acetyltransferase [Ilumatobacteraceae bacterium]
MTTRTLIIHRAGTSVDWADAAALVREHVEWMAAHAGFDPLRVQPALRNDLRDLAAAYRSGAALFLARHSDAAVGIVALRHHDDGSTELKRMFVQPRARGRGVADGLVAAVVDASSEHGSHSVWLETVRGAMDAAIAVYRRNGFVEVRDRRPELEIAGVLVMQRTLTAA